MLDAKSLLGALLQAGTSKATQGRVRHALEEPDLGQSLGSLLGGGTSPGGLGGPGTGGLAELARSVLGRDVGAVGTNRNIAIGAIGALAGSILGGGSRSLKGAARGGALALLGTLAHSALRNRAVVTERIATEEDVPMALREPADPAEEAAAQSQALILLQAMISAAKADGSLDAREIERIMAALDQAEADQDARDFVLYQLKQPADLEGLIAQATSPELAAEVYAASLLAIEIDTPAEHDYLGRLAAGLRLDPAERERLHALVGAPPPA